MQAINLEFAFKSNKEKDKLLETLIRLEDLIWMVFQLPPEEFLKFKLASKLTPTE